MTISEAIDILSERCCSGLDTTEAAFNATPDEFEEALDMAVDALKANLEAEKLTLGGVWDIRDTMKDGYVYVCSVTDLPCSFCQPGPCGSRIDRNFGSR